MIANRRRCLQEPFNSIFLALYSQIVRILVATSRSSTQTFLSRRSKGFIDVRFLTQAATLTIFRFEAMLYNISCPRSEKYDNHDPVQRRPKLGVIGSADLESQIFHILVLGEGLMGDLETFHVHIVMYLVICNSSP